MSRVRGWGTGVLDWALTFVLVASLLLPAASPGQAQSATTVAPTDPVYADLGRLEGFGLVPRGSSASGPWSVARIAWMVRDAGVLAANRDLPPANRDDVSAILARLRARFPVEEPQAPAGWVEVEVGGGRSPGRASPDNGLGRVDAVVNPLWMGRGGRAYGDRSTAAVAARVAVPVGSAVAFTAGARRSGRSSTGEPLPGRGLVAMEALAVRARLGSLALEVGRDHVWTGDGSSRGLALSGNGPPLDLVRLGTDRPLLVHALGDLDFTLFVADLGESQLPAHAKLFGIMANSRPTPGLEVGLTLLNKQFGEGAPDASVADRLKDLTWILDWFRPGVSEFSDKLAQLSMRLAPAEGGASLFADALLTDFDHRRPRHTFQATAGYRVGVELPRLGTSGRHAVGAEASWLGPDLYLHHTYQSGHAAKGFPMGSYLGPDSRSVRVTYGYHPAARGWWGEMGLTLDDWHGDTWRPGDEDEDGPDRLVDNPDEFRIRGDLNVRRTLAGGRAGLDVTLGLERVRSFAYELGDDRVNGAVLIRFWRAF